MRLHVRAINASDFRACWRISVQFMIAPQSEEIAKLAWRNLLSTQRMQGAIVEDLDEKTDTAVKAFGVSVFGSDQAIAMLRNAPHPLWMIDVMSSPDLYVLDLAGIRKRNSGDGLALLVVQHAWTEPAPETSAGFLVADWLTRGFIHCHRGFQLNEIFHQMYLERDLAYVTAGGGYRVRKRFDGWFQDRQLSRFSTNSIALCGISREEAFQQMSSQISTMFAHNPPALFLTPGQQEILLLAVEGMPDTQIRKELGISSDALKMRWKGITERVQGHPKYKAILDDENGGTSRRQRLVNHFKQHYEELRPILREAGTPGPGKGERS